MKYTQSLKGLTVTPREEEIISHYIQTFEKKLSNFAADIPEISIVIKKHEKNHFFSGTITLTLPKKKLVAEVGGHEIKEILHAGFEKLAKEFDVYKAKHFKGSSKHPSQATLEKKNLDV